jgi:DNA repair photolyase
VAVDPLLPDLTDTRANLEPLLDALAESGVKKLTAGYAFLRHGIRANLEHELPEELSSALLAEYEGGPVLPMASLAPARHLPRRERDRGYARLLTLAAQRGIQMSVSALSNPDFPLSGSGGSPERRWRQQELACVR